MEMGLSARWRPPFDAFDRNPSVLVELAMPLYLARDFFVFRRYYHGVHGFQWAILPFIFVFWDEVLGEMNIYYTLITHIIIMLLFI